MNRVLAVFAVITTTVLLVACGGGGDPDADDKAAIEATLRGYVAVYNASDFERALDYMTGYGDRQDALDGLAFLRPLAGEASLDSFDPDSFDITPPSAPGQGPTARVPVEFTLGGDAGSQTLLLQKIGDEWKIVWEQ